MSNNHSSTPERQEKAAVCVRPIFGPYDNLEQMAQFLAYYSSVLGVATFHLPLLEVSPRVAEFLASLQDSGTQVDVLDWNLEHKLRNWTVLWDYGALLALTDCVYK